LTRPIRDQCSKTFKISCVFLLFSRKKCQKMFGPSTIPYGFDRAWKAAQDVLNRISKKNARSTFIRPKRVMNIIEIQHFLFYFRIFSNQIAIWLWFSWSPSKTASTDIWVNIFRLKNIFRNFFTWCIRRIFSEFLFQKKFRRDMSLESVFDRDYESAIIMCSIYAYR